MKESTFLEKCKGVAYILFAVAAIIYSAQSSPVTATNPTNTHGTGKYMMQYNSCYADGAINWYILVWDTETGHSKMYYGNPKMGKISASSSAYNLPSDPL